MRTELGENNITNSTLATQHQQQQHQQQQQQHKMSPAAIFMGNQPNWVLKLVVERPIRVFYRIRQKSF